MRTGGRLGPSFEMEAHCHGCRYLRMEEGCDLEGPRWWASCTHKHAPKLSSISAGVPKWCPLYRDALRRFVEKLQG